MKLVLFSLLVTITVVFCWDLSDLGIESNYYASSIVVFRNRAFLALPRSACQNSENAYTVVEVAWTGEHQPLIRRRPSIVNIKQEQGNCHDLQNAVSLDIEPRRPRLWILDKGTEACPAKLLGYSIIQNSLTHEQILTNVPNKNLNFLVFDPVYNDMGIRAYIGDPGDDSLIVFSLNNMDWWKVKLFSDHESVFSIPTSYLAVSRTESILYMCGENSTHLFSMNTEAIRNSEDPLPVEDTVEMEQNATYVGEKLGPSVGLVTDIKNGLSYYSVRDYAILRWITRGPLIAEYHNVLAQSYERLPYVSQLFIGPQNGIWALVNPVGPVGCSNSEKVPEIEDRAVKILKYNRREKKVLL